MKVKPKEVLLNLPIVLMFQDYHEVPIFASNINQVLHGKIRVKYEELGLLGGQYVGLFYLQRNDEFDELRASFVQMIEQEEMKKSEPKKCNHNWVLDGHNAGDPICSECLARE